MLVAAPQSVPANVDPETWRRLAAQEAVYGSEFGTVQGGAWQEVSTARKPGEMPLPPQVQAEALRREREAAQAKAVAAKTAREKAAAEKRIADEKRRVLEAAARTAAPVAPVVATGRVCAQCKTPAPQGTGITAFSFCLNCGASFVEKEPAPVVPQTTVPVVPPPVITSATVTSPVGVLQQQARREVRKPVGYAPVVRVAERDGILPVTEATPYVAAILSFLIPGAGQLRNAQWGKGFLLLMATFTLLALLPIGLWSVTALILRSLVALDAFRIAERHRRGKPVSQWQWDATLIPER